MFPSLRYDLDTYTNIINCIKPEQRPLLYIDYEEENKYHEFIFKNNPTRYTVHMYINSYLAGNSNVRHSIINHDVESELDVQLIDTIMSSERDEQDDMPPCQPLLLRFTDNRVNFNSIWYARDYRYFPSFMIDRLFFSKCVYPNVLHTLSEETLIELVECRDEKMKAIKAEYKKNILELYFIEEIAGIIVDYIQPIELWPTTTL